MAAARKQAQELVKRAQAPKADFARWRRQFAGRQQPRTGRRHRLLPLAQLTPEMRPAVEQLKTGDVSAPVQSAAGFHILKLADLRPAGVTPFDQVRANCAPRCAASVRNLPRALIWRAC